MKWNHYKNLRKLYRYLEDERYIKFIYYNYSYSRQSLWLVHMLWEELFKDFPFVAEDDIFISMAPEFPHEILLSIYIDKELVPEEKLSEFEVMPKDLWEL